MYCLNVWAEKKTANTEYRLTIRVHVLRMNRYVTICLSVDCEIIKKKNDTDFHISSTNSP